MHKTFLFAWLLLAGTAFAQPGFMSTNSPVYHAVISADQAFIALVDHENVSVIRTADFSLVKQWKYDPSKTGAVSELFFSPKNSQRLFIRYSAYNGQYSTWDGDAYPNDSIFIYDLVKDKVGALAGHVFAAPGNRDSTDVMAYNQFQPMACYGAGMEGKSCYYAQKGGIAVFPSKTMVDASGIINAIRLDHKDSLLAIVNYSSISDNKSQYTLEIRNLPTLGILVSKTFAQKPLNLHFSTDSRYLYAEFDAYPNRNIEIFAVADLSEPKNYPKNINIPPYVWNGNLVKKKEFEVVSINLASKKQNWELWANLTQFFSIDGFIPLNEKEVVVFGKTRSANGTADQKGGIQKLNLSDLEMYSGMEQEFKTDTLFQPADVTVQDNQLYRKGYRSGDQSVLTAGKGELLFHTNANMLQIWSMKDRQKLYEFRFDNEVKIFPDREGKTALVLEKYTKKNFDDLRVHLLNLETGILQTKTIADVKYRELNLSNCGCVASPVENNAWVCYNGYPFHWLVKGSDLSITKVAGNEEENSHSFTRMQTAHNAGKYLFYQRVNPSQDEEEQAFVFDAATYAKKLVEIRPSKNKLFLVNDTLVAYQQKQEIILADVRTGETKKRIKTGAYRLLSVTGWAGQTCFVLESEKNKLDSLSVHLLGLKKDTEPLIFKMPYSQNHTLTPGGLVYVDDDRLLTYDPVNKVHIPWSDLEEHRMGRSIVFDGQRYLLHEYGNLVDLATLKTKTVIPFHYRATLLRGKMSGNLIYLEGNNAWDSDKHYFEVRISTVQDYKKAVWRSGKIPLGEKESDVNAILVSHDGGYAVIFTEYHFLSKTSPVYLLNVETRTMTELTHQEIRSVTFSGDEQQVLVTNTKGESLVFAVADGKKEKQLTSLYVPMPGKAGYTLTAGFGGVSLCKMVGDTVQGVKDYYAKEMTNTAVFLEKQGWIVGGGNEGNLYIWREDKQSPAAVIRCGFEGITHLAEHDGTLLVFAGNTITFIDAVKLNVKLTLNLVPREKGIAAAWYTQDGFFSAAKKDVVKLHMVKGLKTYPVLSYELFLNRPDIILNNTGFAGTETVGLFKSAFDKRLSRSGYKNISAITQVQKPEVVLLNKENIPAVTKEEKLLLKIKAIAQENSIDRVHIYINGVAVFGSSGIKTNTQKEIALEKEIALATGLNQISVVSVNDKGVESAAESFSITCTKEQEGKTYYIGMGVSAYRNKEFNLEYAAKDAQDMQQAFAKKFPGAQTLILTDSMVTLENIRQLKKNVLEKTNVNDVVVLSFSGHGIISRDLDFYYGTHDIDFNAPEKRGLLYSEIEWLLDSIPALRKLVLVDACHSGELDKEEVETMAAQKTLDTGVKFRDAGTVTAIKKVGMVSVSEITAELFADLRKGTGATVISSSGGAEYSMESGEWKNGLFTYCLLYGLETREADLDRNGQVMLGELTEYLQNKVSTLSKGKQQPTSRMENVSMDFKIW